MTIFTDMDLNPILIENLSEAGFHHPTPIQSLVIPLVLSGADLISIAQTGTGKTGAFCIPIIHHLTKNLTPIRKGEPRVLILAPTRELCLQIQGTLEVFAKELGIKSAAIIGGVDQSVQVKRLQEGVSIVVATPGRLLDLLGQKLIRVAKVEIFVLDEADRMLDMGFIEDIEVILESLPISKQSMFFSATMSPSIEKLAFRFLNHPKKLEITPSGSVPLKINERVILCSTVHKLQLLKKIIKEEKDGHFLIFTKTKSSTENIVQYLAYHRTASKVFHGDMKQPDRERALHLFKDGSIRVLVATDMASRGIDVEGITHVINFELPLSPETYVHRIGRTARAGQEGVAISFCDDSEKEMFKRIQALTKIDYKLERFEGKKEILGIKLTGTRKIIPPTPGKSQEKTAYLDHSKRQKPLKEGERRIHPGFKNNTKKKRK